MLIKSQKHPHWHCWHVMLIKTYLSLVEQTKTICNSSIMRPTLDGCPRVQIPKTHLKQIQSLSWNLPSTLACILILQIMSSLSLSFSLSLELFVLSMNQFDFLLQNGAVCRFSLDLPPSLDLRPSFKRSWVQFMASQPIGLLHSLYSGP
jgi:hypothetical protein